MKEMIGKKKWKRTICIIVERGRKGESSRGPRIVATSLAKAGLAYTARREVSG